jgi:hypothetical protein
VVVGRDWTTVEAYIARSRITRVDESLHRNCERLVPGVTLLDRVQARFGWSDRQLARALGVTPAVVSRYRRTGFRTSSRAVCAGCPGYRSRGRSPRLQGVALKAA